MTNVESSLRRESDRPNADTHFVDYYASASLSPRTAERFANVKRKILALRLASGTSAEGLSVVDIGCGAGTQSLLWAGSGHKVSALDVSVPLIGLGKQRAAERGLDVDFSVGSATALPYANESFDVVLLPELLEHIEDWQLCLDEATRVLRTSGILYLSTTNVLCPKQQEFSLPLYSWYPAFLKKRCERMAVTTHRQWVKHTSFPAIHWFTFYQLRDEVTARGLEAYDRFDMVDRPVTVLKRAALDLVKRRAVLRLAGHVLTPYTTVFGVKRAGASSTIT